jgi:hypothetical protein
VRGLTEALARRTCIARSPIQSTPTLRRRHSLARQLSVTPGLFDDEIVTSLRTIYSAGMNPVELAEHLMTAIRRNHLYVIPYPEARASLQAAFDAVLAALPPEDSDRQGVPRRQAAMARFIEEGQERQKRQKAP